MTNKEFDLRQLSCLSKRLCDAIKLFENKIIKKLTSQIMYF